MASREQNEKQFGQWLDLPDGRRHYWYDIAGRHGWFARYNKIVDATETTVRFYQEIFNAGGKLVSRHEKYPRDQGHQDVEA